MSPTSTGHGGQYDTKYSFFDEILRAVFVGREFTSCLNQPVRVLLPWPRNLPLSATVGLELCYRPCFCRSRLQNAWKASVHIQPRDDTCILCRFRSHVDSPPTTETVSHTIIGMYLPGLERCSSACTTTRIVPGQRYERLRGKNSSRVGGKEGLICGQKPHREYKRGE